MVGICKALICTRLTLKSEKYIKILNFTSLTMDQYVNFNSNLHTLICLQHKFGLSPNWIERHFRESHKNILLKRRQEIITYSKSLDLWHPERVNTLLRSLVPIPELPIIQGWKCQDARCGELRSTKLSMKKHCRNNHGWKTVDGEKWISQAMQAVFPSQHYLPVTIPFSDSLKWWRCWRSL